MDVTMDEHDWPTEGFASNRSHLRAVAYRMLGSLSEADDAVQEAWLRFSRSDTSGIDNLGGWLTTVVGRVCLDMLRARKSLREREMQLGRQPPQLVAGPEDEVLLADSVGLALLVVLETLTPAERLAFVLHDMFDLPFDEIATIVGRTPMAARQLASRARRRVRGGDTAPDGVLADQREVVDAFLAASRDGDFDALLAVLDPDVVLSADRLATKVHGAQQVARRALAGRNPLARPALVNGGVGIIVAPGGRLRVALSFRLTDGKITAIDVVDDPDRLERLEIGVL